MMADSIYMIIEVSPKYTVPNVLRTPWERLRSTWFSRSQHGRVIFREKVPGTANLCIDGRTGRKVNPELHS